MTPASLRAAIASARLRPRMYGTDAHDLSGYLHGLTAGAYDGPLNVAAQWQSAWTTAGWRPNDPRADDVVCDVADRVVAALWPQGDAPARRAAEAGALDLDAIEALARKVVSDDADGGYAMWSTLELARDRVPALVARVRELEAEAADMREGVAYAVASCDREIQVHGVWLRASRRGPPSDVHHYAEVAAARDEALAEVKRLRAQLAAAQPVLMLDAIRRGPPSTWVRCLACGGTRADVDGAPCEPCRGTGLQPPPSDTDLCPRCGAFDLDHDHACAKSAATVAGEAFATEHPYAAAGIMGSATAREGKG